MKTSHVLQRSLLWSLLCASPAFAVRDPFWPIGYSPAATKAPDAVRSEAPAPKTESPREMPVTDDDWAKARKTLTISGTTKSTRQGTQETRALVMINRQMYAVGDTVSLIHQEISFRWRVAQVTDKDVRLEPLHAERIVPKTTDLKQSK